MSTTITIKKKIYEGNTFTRGGTVFSSTIAVDGFDFGTPPTTGLHRDGTLSAEIDNAFRKLIQVRTNKTPAVDVTVNLPDGYALSVSLQQHYRDKYSIEPEIASVTFV